mmetsp:Transcript_16344/g.23685  ORF Transcript_16344/g.23685 Transcript_16344/m.23685 type:complete len:173 (-) Transcript_16344:1959-2477(-)
MVRTEKNYFSVLVKHNTCRVDCTGIFASEETCFMRPRSLEFTVKIESLDLDENGWLINFRDIKNILRTMGKKIEGKVLVPAKCRYLSVETTPSGVCLSKENMLYEFEKSNCEIMDTENCEVEYLAKYVCEEIVTKLTMQSLRDRNVTKVQVRCEELPQLKSGIYEVEIPHNT